MWIRLSISGFRTNRNKKSHPIHGKNGVDEKSFSVTEKGMNDKIEVKIKPYEQPLQNSPESSHILEPNGTITKLKQSHYRTSKDYLKLHGFSEERDPTAKYLRLTNNIISRKIGGSINHVIYSKPTSSQFSTLKHIEEFYPSFRHSYDVVDDNGDLKEFHSYRELLHNYSN